MEKVKVRFNSNGGYYFGMSLKGHTVTANKGLLGEYYVNSNELVRIGCVPDFVDTDHDWLFTEEEVTELSKRYSFAAVLSCLSRLRKRAFRMLKLGKRK